MIIPCFLALIMLAVMWGIVYTYAAANGLPPTITLSEGLEDIPGLKDTYIAFLSILGVALIPITGSVLIYTICFEGRVLDHWYKTPGHKCLIVCTALYVVFSWGKVIALAFVAVYDLSNHAQHYLAAFLAFGLILLANMMLLARRWLIFHFLGFKQCLHTDGIIEKPCFMKHDELYKNALLILSSVNTVFFLLQLTCAIIFAATSDGRAECALTFIVIADMFFQPFDFYFDEQSLIKHGFRQREQEPLLLTTNQSETGEEEEGALAKQ